MLFQNGDLVEFIPASELFGDNFQRLADSRLMRFALKSTKKQFLFLFGAQCTITLFLIGAF